MDIFSVALSGMRAASVRLDVSASNVANMLTNGRLSPAGGAGATPAPYAALRVDQVEVAGGGTAANVSTVSPSDTPGYDPSAPYADGNGMVAMPNVDLVNEAIAQITAEYAFKASAVVLRTASGMTQTLLDSIGPSRPTS
jgi:flagellar basal-body rod protein FlgC